jgi:hypothetical protein
MRMMTYRLYITTGKSQTRTNLNIRIRDEGSPENETKTKMASVLHLGIIYYF